MTAPLGLVAYGVRRRGQEAERVLWERSVVEQRYDAVREVLEGRPVTEVAARYGVSRQSVYTWVGRYRAGGLAGLQDRSHRPNNSPGQDQRRGRGGRV